MAEESDTDDVRRFEVLVAELEDHPESARAWAELATVHFRLGDVNIHNRVQPGP